MKRRTLDFIFSIGGILVAVLLVAVGAVFSSNANFAKDYVKDQLSEQKIIFTPAENLSDEEKKVDCLVAYAGAALDSGKKAECYANEYIGLHVTNIGGGETYATLGAKERAAKQAVTDAEAANAANLEELKAEAATITGTRETVFKGETLRGLLLTSYGFSIFGEKAALAATIAYIGALVMLLAGLAGFIHAARTPKGKTVI